MVLGIVKHFLWRACINLLPTQIDLRRKKRLIEQAVCLICEHEDESLIHILQSCPAAIDVWGERAKPFWKRKTSIMDLWFFQMKMVGVLTQRERELSTIIYRIILFRRNSLIFQGNFDSPKFLVESALKQQDAFYFALSPHFSPTSTMLAAQPINSIRWKKPNGHWLKTN